MKLIVTGGAGLVGSHCAEYFAKQKHHVTVIDNLLRSQIFGADNKSVEYNWQYLKKYKNVSRVKQDVRDLPAMLRIFKRVKPQVVIHAAGQPGVKFSLRHPLEDYSINATGTLNVLEALKQSNKKGTFIYCSTNKVFGDNVNKVTLKEKKKRYEFRYISGIKENFSIDLTGHTPYGVSKLTGDLYTQDYAKTHGLKSGVFRMSCIYGTRQFGFEDQGWLAWFANRYFLNKPVTIFGDGKQTRDVLWVGDLVQAFDAFIRSDYQAEVFNMGGGLSHTLSLLELTDILQAVSQRDIRIHFGAWRKFDQKVYVSDITKAKKMLKWKPTVPPQEGVERLYHWIEANEKIFHSFVK